MYLVVSFLNISFLLIFLAMLCDNESIKNTTDSSFC